MARRRGILRWVFLWMAITSLGAKFSTEIRRLSADYEDGDLSIWVHTPEVAVGDTATVEIGVFGRHEVQLVSVDVFVDSRVTQRILYRDPPAGDQLGGLWVAAEFASVRIPISHDGEVPVRLHITWVGDGVFSSYQEIDLPTSRFTFEIPVHSRARVVLWRLLIGLAAALVLAAACLVQWRGHLGRLRAAVFATAPRRVLSLLLWTAAGYWWFSACVATATGEFHPVLRVVTTGVWVLAPLLAAPFGRRAAALPTARQVD